MRKRLEPLAGLPGRTTYADGSVRIETADETITVRPPFGLAHARVYESVELGPLFEALAEDHVVAALLVRLGGYAVGVFEGERLVASKVGSRFVKGRHKKGGSSANRFRRRREEQERELIDAAAATAERVLEPYRQRIEHVALGGDRAAAEKVAERLPWLEREAARALLHRPRSEAARARAASLRAVCGRAQRGAVTASRSSATVSPAARTAEWVSAARKSSRSSANSSEGETARTVAVRGTSRSRAISPKKSPRPALPWAPFAISSSPLSTM